MVRASIEGESRRNVLAGLLAGAAALTASRANAIDLFDDRKAKKAGYDIIYEARDLDLPQNVREGFTQARESIAETKKRVAESGKRISNELEPVVSKAYWTEAREQLRRQVGTLRFDLNTLASTLEKPAKVKALSLKDEFLAEVEALDYALVKKDKETALKKLETVKAKLGNVLSTLA